MTGFSTALPLRRWELGAGRGEGKADRVEAELQAGGGAWSCSLSRTQGPKVQGLISHGRRWGVGGWNNFHPELLVGGSFNPEEAPWINAADSSRAGNGYI